MCIFFQFHGTLLTKSIENGDHMKRNQNALDRRAQLLTHPQEIKFAQWLYQTVAGIAPGTADIYRVVDHDSARFFLHSPTKTIPILLDRLQFDSLTRQYFGYNVQPITLEELENKYLEEVARRIYAEWAYRQLLQRGVPSLHWDQLSAEDKEGFFEEAKEHLQMPFD
jgi:hypothetical protein